MYVTQVKRSPILNCLLGFKVISPKEENISQYILMNHSGEGKLNSATIIQYRSTDLLAKRRSNSEKKSIRST